MARPPSVCRLRRHVSEFQNFFIKVKPKLFPFSFFEYKGSAYQLFKAVPRGLFMLALDVFHAMKLGISNGRPTAIGPYALI